MAVSKRIRYEVLRRDNYACRYCGGSAPDVALTVDHVIPTALGGSDDPSNLVAACGPCNSGKTSTSPDGPLVADVAQDALRWAAAMERAAEERGAYNTKLSQICNSFAEEWFTYTTEDGTYPFLPADFGTSIEQIWLAGLPPMEIIDSLIVAMHQHGVQLDNRFRYFCGVAWTKVRKQQSRAAEILAEDQGATYGT